MSMRKQAEFVVIFTSTLSEAAGYETAAERMLELVQQQPGFLGFESARGEDGLGITVSYWDSEESIRAWRDQPEHAATRKRGRDTWYSSFHLTVAKVQKEQWWTKETRGE